MKNVVIIQIVKRLSLNCSESADVTRIFSMKCCHHALKKNYPELTGKQLDLVYNKSKIYCIFGGSLSCNYIGAKAKVTSLGMDT